MGPVILGRVRRTLVERKLLRGRPSRVLIACSGGPDSVALVDVLSRLAPELELGLEVACVDHGLRASAASEMELVEALAQERGLAFHPLRVDLGGVTRSLHAAARRARYEALLGCARRQGATEIATGHTMDDQAETVLTRLLSGAGPGGLAGILPRRRDGVVRPLLDLRRAAVLGYAEARGLPFVRDPSNANPRFLRARLRSEALPFLQRYDARLVEQFHALADQSRQARQVVRRSASRLVRASGGIDGEALLLTPRLLAALPAVQDEALAGWVARRSGHRPRRSHRLALHSLLVRRKGEVRLPNGFVVRIEEDALVVRDEGRGSLRKPKSFR